MDLKTLITSLCGLYSVSGAEAASTQGVERILLDLFDEHVTDGVGNHVFIKRCGRKNAPKILVDAHFDEIGMMVTDITEDDLESRLTVYNKGNARVLYVSATENVALKIVLTVKRVSHGSFVRASFRVALLVAFKGENVADRTGLIASRIIAKRIANKGIDMRDLSCEATALGVAGRVTIMRIRMRYLAHKAASEIAFRIAVICEAVGCDPCISAALRVTLCIAIV